MSSNVEIFTIGVYGFTPESFFDALASAGIDTFCDIRRRRGVRGSEYSFANANRLKQELADRSIRYFHFLDLSPSLELRNRQYAVDKETHTTKRKRTELSEEFVAAYREECLAGFDSAAFISGLGPGAKRVVLFCVEREAAACHRSVLAERLAQELGISITHLSP